MKIYKPDQQIMNDIRYNVEPGAVALCKKHSGSRTAIKEINGVLAPSCVYCTVERNYGKYPRIAYCPSGVLKKFPFFDKDKYDIWLEGNDLILVPAPDHLDLYIKHPHCQNISNYPDKELLKIHPYKRVMLDEWSVKLDSYSPPIVMSYPEIWKDTGSNSIVIRSLADYKPKLTSKMAPDSIKSLMYG